MKSVCVVALTKSLEEVERALQLCAQVIPSFSWGCISSKFESEIHLFARLPPLWLLLSSSSKKFLCHFRAAEARSEVVYSFTPKGRRYGILHFGCRVWTNQPVNLSNRFESRIWTRIFLLRTRPTKLSRWVAALHPFFDNRLMCYKPA